MSDGPTRRALLLGAGSTAAALAGCAGLFEDDDVIRDTDGDGVIDSEDYAPRDPDVQEKSDLVTTGTTPTTAPGTTPADTPTQTDSPTETLPVDRAHSPERTVPSSSTTRIYTATPTPDGDGEVPTRVDQPLPGDPAPLLSFAGDPIRATAGETTTVAGEIGNPYLFPVDNVQITFEPPGGWSVTPVSGVTFDFLDAQDIQPVEFELTAPDSADGEYLLLANVVYATRSHEASAWTGATVVV